VARVDHAGIVAIGKKCSTSSFCRAMLWVRRSAQETPAASDDRSGPIAPGRDRMPYSEEHKQETRQKILESARRLFNKKGFAEVSIDEVMESAG